jgi:acyl dehydratase
MAFSAERLLQHEFAPVRQSYTERDVILYALGLGLGADPSEEASLAFLLEDRLQTLPTFAVTLGSPGMWVKEPSLEIDWVKLVHVAQHAHFFASIPPAAEIVGKSRVVEVSDRGAKSGAVVMVERVVSDAASGAVLCEVLQSYLLRGNGGFGGAPPSRSREAAPVTEPDLTAQAAISQRAALIYRLSGDWNPLHADPQVARSAGFERPILHGLASFGMASVRVSQALGRSVTDASSVETRFAGIVYPGDQLDFSIWRTPTGAIFRAHVGSRLVLDGGRIDFRS